MKILPYKIGSASAKSLAEALGCVRVNPNKETRVKGDTLINWGCSKITRPLKFNHVVNAIGVKEASNKLSTLKILQEAGVGIPDFTESREEASKWLAEGFDVCVRHKLSGHSGDGLEIVGIEGDNEVPDAPLYTKYIPKKHEYRVHVAFGEVIFVQRKARKLEIPDENVNWKVRNLAGGFIYANEDVAIGGEAYASAVAAVEALGLDFGAVDIIYNEKRAKYYILEVNTAPGLTGSTLNAYVEAFNGIR